MRQTQAKTWFLIPFYFFKGQEFFNKLVVCTSLLALSGCVTTGKSEPLAPSPPLVTSSSYLIDQSQLSYQPHYFAAPLQVALLEADTLPIIEDTLISQQHIGGEQALPVNGELGALSLSKKCRMKDRFDRKAVLAYEWGRSRVALDVDGINLGGGGAQAVRIEYKIRFQPEKPKIQRCRYSSSWQGLIGSGYHEFFVREEDTVWGEIKEMKANALDYLDGVF